MWIAGLPVTLRSKPDPLWPSRLPVWSASLNRDSGIPNRFSGFILSLQNYVGSSSASRSLLVHGFPCTTGAHGASEILFPVLKVLPSITPWRDCQASSALNHQYYP
jgi:hypothetical protein